MTYGDMPADPAHPVAEVDKDRVLYAGVPFDNQVMMFSDIPSGHTLVKGSNISPTLSTPNKDEVVRIFNELAEGGKVQMELGATFFSELYGMVEDKFGIPWQVLYYVPAEK
jgi:PhnB protein